MRTSLASLVDPRSSISRENQRGGRERARKKRFISLGETFDALRKNQQREKLRYRVVRQREGERSEETVGINKTKSSRGVFRGRLACATRAHTKPRAAFFNCAPPHLRSRLRSISMVRVDPRSDLITFILREAEPPATFGARPLPKRPRCLRESRGKVIIPRLLLSAFFSDLTDLIDR